MAVRTPRETIRLSLHRAKIQTQTLKVGLTGIADAGLLKPSRRPVCRMPRCCRRRFELLLEILSGLRDTGPRKSEILHDTPPGPPESHYLLCSPGKPVSAAGFARMITFATNSVLWCLAAFMLYPAINTRSREPHGRCAIGAIPILQISWVAGKIPGATAIPSRFLRQAPAAHEYCS